MKSVRGRITSHLETTQVGNVLHDLITCLNRLAVEFEGPLGCDQVNQFLDRFNVGSLEVALSKLSKSLIAGVADLFETRCIGRQVHVLAQLQQSIRVDELGHLNLALLGQLDLPGQPWPSPDRRCLM